jgi:hypothetical protein
VKLGKWCGKVARRVVNGRWIEEDGMTDGFKRWKLYFS